MVLRLLGDAARGTAEVEGPHGELGAGLADRLRRDHADRLADVDDLAGGQIAAVARLADAAARLAGEHRADLHPLDTGSLHVVGGRLGDQLPDLDHLVAAGRIVDVLLRGTADDAVAQRLEDVATLHDRAHGDAVDRAAVLLGDDDVLRHVDQPPGQVAGVGRLERGVGEALARAVGRDEVLEHRQPLAEVGGDRRLDDLARGLGHQAAHSGQLPHLLARAAGAGVGHHADRVELAEVVLDLGHLPEHLLGDLLGHTMPDVDDLVVPLTGGDDAAGALLLDLADLLVGVGQELGLGARDEHVVDAERDSRARGVVEGDLLHLVEHLHGQLMAVLDVAVADELLEPALLEQAVDEWNLVGQMEIHDHPADGGVHDTGLELLDIGVEQVLVVEVGLEIDQLARVAHADLRVRLDDALVERQQHRVEVVEDAPLALRPGLAHGQVVAAQNHVLAGHRQRPAVRRAEDVVRGQHQHLALDLRLGGERHVDRHLVAVEVGVEGGAHERMDLDRLALDQHRLERLDAEPMERRGAVEEHRVVANDLLEGVPHRLLLALDHLLGRLDRADQLLLLERVVDERLEQLERHLLGQPALVDLELGADDDDRAAGVVDPLAEQVLTEAPLLALEGVGERLERPVVGALEHAAAPAVVEQRVDRLLQHALLVAHDHVGRAQLEQLLEAVVAVDDAAVEIVQIARREATAVERHQGTQLGRDDRDDVENHPLGTVAAAAEGVDHLEPLGRLEAPDLAGLGAHHDAQLLGELVGVDAAQELLDRLGAHARGEGALLGIGLAHLAELLLGEQLALLELGVAGVDDDVALEVEDALEIAQAQIEQLADAARQALEEPDVRHRRGQVDVTHPLTAHPRARHLDAALVAHHATVLHALVLAAQALPVGDRAEDLGAEETVTLRLEGAVVDGLRLGDLAEAPRPDLLRRGDRDLDRVEIARRLVGSVESSKRLQRLPPYSAFRSSISRQRLWSSRTSTLKDSGRPGSSGTSPLTIAS